MVSVLTFAILFFVYLVFLREYMRKGHDYNL